MALNGILAGLVGVTAGRPILIFRALPKVMVDVAVPREMVDATVEAIANAAKTGKIGDGKIFVFAVEQAVRIRTAETGDGAL